MRIKKHFSLDTVGGESAGVTNEQNSACCAPLYRLSSSQGSLLPITLIINNREFGNRNCDGGKQNHVSLLYTGCIKNKYLHRGKIGGRPTDRLADGPTHLIVETRARVQKVDPFKFKLAVTYCII